MILFFLKKSAGRLISLTASTTQSGINLTEIPNYLQNPKTVFFYVAVNGLNKYACL